MFTKISFVILTFVVLQSSFNSKKIVDDVKVSYNALKKWVEFNGGAVYDITLKYTNENNRYLVANTEIEVKSCI